jgi:hypothetical protein
VPTFNNNNNNNNNNEVTEEYRLTDGRRIGKPKRKASGKHRYTDSVFTASFKVWCQGKYDKR